jgi:ABC-type xylose transport system permease subunit
VKTVGAVAAVALARANVSPWQVLWWILVAAVILASLVYAAGYFRRWWRGTEPPGIPSPVVALAGGGCSLVAWGMVAGWATLP